MPATVYFQVTALEPLMVRSLQRNAALLDQRMRRPLPLKPADVNDLVAFIRDGLHDPRVTAYSLCQLAPASVPSGRPVLQFEACQ